MTLAPHAATLLADFLRFDCDARSRGDLLEAIADEARPWFELNFNCHVVTLKRANDAVVLESVLDASPEGTATFTIAEFKAALGGS